MATIPDAASSDLVPVAVDMSAPSRAISQASEVIAGIANDLRASLDKLFVQCRGATDCIIKGANDQIKAAIDAAKAAIADVTGRLDDKTCSNLAFVKTIADYAGIPSFDMANVCGSIPLAPPAAPPAPTGQLTLPPVVVVPGGLPIGGFPFPGPSPIPPSPVGRFPGPSPGAIPVPPLPIGTVPGTIPIPGQGIGPVPPITPPAPGSTQPGAGTPSPLPPSAIPLPSGIAPFPPGTLPAPSPGVLPFPAPGPFPGPFPGQQPPPSPVPSPGPSPGPSPAPPTSLPPSPPEPSPGPEPAPGPSPAPSPGTVPVPVVIVNEPKQPYGGDLAWLEKSEGQPEEAALPKFWGKVWDVLNGSSTFAEVLANSPLASEEF